MNNQNTSTSHIDRFDKTNKFVTLAMLLALVAFLGTVPPYLGYVQLPILPFMIVIIHVPVIIGAVLLGPKEGAILGFVFGITSVMHATFTPTATSFLFSPFVPYGSWKSAVIAIVPRILVGLFAALIFRLLSRWDKSKVGAALIAGIIGSLTNTVFVLGGLYLLFQDQYTSMMKLSASDIKGVLIALGTVVLTNGVAEAVAAAVLVPAVSKAVFTAMRRR